MKPDDVAHFLRTLRALGVDEPEQEHAFHPTRKWRFDFAWPHVSLALEFEGGIWVGGMQGMGAHNRPIHMLKDMEKYSEAALLRWFVLRAPPKDARNGEAAWLVARFFGLVPNVQRPTRRTDGKGQARRSTGRKRAAASRTVLDDRSELFADGGHSDAPF